MAYLIHIGLAILVQVLFEEAGLAPAPRLWLAAVACFVPHALGALTHRLYLRGRFRGADRAFMALNWSPVLLHALIVIAGGWIPLLEAATGRSMDLLGWPSAWALLALAPFAGFSLLAIDARSRLGLGPRARALHQRRFQFRIFAVSCTPLLAYVLISSIVGAIEPARTSIDTVAVWYAAYMIVLFLLFASSMPWLLRNSWETEPMAGGVERSLLESVAALAGFDGSRLFVWRTDQSVANAAIIGLFPRHRVVLFSDLLLAQLDLRELASVFAHEIGHAKRGHVLIFGAWALAALFGADVLATRLAPGDELWQGAVLLCSTAIWAILFGWMSRRFELEADLYSLRLLGEVEPLIRALEKVSGPHGRARTSWRHFSTERRIEFLEAAVRDPAVGERLERKLTWVARLGIVLFALVMAVEGHALVRQWPTDQLLLDLRRGDYAAAVRRVESRSVEDLDLTRLVERAATLRSGDVVEIETRARAALANQDFAALGQWLDLGSLRGDEDMARVGEILSELKSAPPPGDREVEALRERVPPSWRDALDPLLQPARR